MNWLFKEEPSSYSFEEFTKDGGTVWAGVKNPLAQKHLRSVMKGDRIFYYHTGNQKAVVGIAKATSDAYPDPKDKAGKAVVVDVAAAGWACDFVGRLVETGVTGRPPAAAVP